MLVSEAFPSPVQSRAAALGKLRLLLSRHSGSSQTSHARLPFGLAALDDHLPNRGLAGDALHEIVPATQAAFPAALGFVVAIRARFIFPPSPGPRLRAPECMLVGEGKERRWTSADVRASPRHHPAKKIVFVMPSYGLRRCGRLSGHGLNHLGFDPARAILVETANLNDTLWTLLEALRSGAPQAVAGMVDRLDLKTSQKLHLAAVDAGLPLLLLRPAQTLESSAAATRWRLGAALAARDRFGSYTQPRWRLQLERCRNGRLGEWVVEYDHVAHRFSLVAALADLSFSHGADDQFRRQASRS